MVQTQKNSALKTRQSSGSPKSAGASKASALIERVLPLIIFPAIASIALKYMTRNLTFFDERVRGGTCLPGQPFVKPYTGLPSVDEGLCLAVSFLHASMEPTTRPFLTHFVLANIPTATLIAFIESARATRPAVLGFPTTVSQLCQFLSVGLTMPFYWLLFLITGAGSRPARDPGAFVSNGRACALGFGIIVGGIIPYIVMVAAGNPYITALWQIYPVYIYAAQQLFLLARPDSSHPESGYSVIKALYILCAVGSAAVHLTTVGPLFLHGGVSETISFFQPSVSPLPKASLSALSLDLLQWESDFSMFAAAVATLFFAHNAKEVLGLVVWYVVSTPVLGAGATVAAVALWRESRIQPAA